MPHVSLITFAGLRVGEERLLELGMSLPGLPQRAGALSELPALGLLTLAGMLPEHWSCDYEAPVGSEVDLLVDRIVSRQPDLVALSALTASIDLAYRVADRLRDEGLRVVLGGLHVTACPDEASLHADAVVVGHGELVWPSVLADAESGALAPRYDARTMKQPLPWPKPRFDLLGGVPKRFTLQTQRGCPLACEFCAASRLLGEFREKPAERIADELAMIQSMSARPWIELADDNTFAGGRDAHELLGVLSAADARFFTESDWRLGERPDVVRGLADAGCAQVLVGVESTVFRYPGMGRKAAELDRMLDAVRAIQEAGVAVNGCFIVGADGETDESVDRLVEFLDAAPFAEIQLTLQTPFPGTRLYDRLNRSGRLIEGRGWSHYTLFDVTHVPDRMTVAGLEAAFERAVRGVFRREATDRRRDIRRRVWRNNPRMRPRPR